MNIKVIYPFKVNFDIAKVSITIGKSHGKISFNFGPGLHWPQFEYNIYRNSITSDVCTTQEERRVTIVGIYNYRLILVRAYNY